MKIRIIIAATLLAFSLTALAEHHEVAEAKREMPSINASRSMQVTATVEAINHETREVTLKTEDGESVSFVASEEARNLGQVSVGDLLYAKVFEEVNIQLVEADGAEPGAGEISGLARSDEGEMPAGMAVSTQIITATVEEINLEDNTFKLKGPMGNVNQFTARFPENLKLARVGDLVVITKTNAVAISVEEQAAE
jgi:hypothetical protein